MKSPIWLGLLLGLLAGHAGAAQNAPPSVPLVSTGPCGGSSACPGVPNDSTHWFYGFDPTVNASIQQLLTALGQPLTINTAGLATSALQTAGNASLVTIATASALQATAAKQDTAQTSLTTVATAQGIQGTGSTFNPPTGGSGILGYLSGIYKAITGTLTVSGSVTTTSSATSTPLTPTDISPSSNLTLVTGGASQTLVAANACPNFVTINNATTAAGQGIAAAESAWVKRTGGTVSMTGGGTSTEIAAGVTQSFLASTVIMTWTAPTTGHKINAWCE